MQEWMSLVEIEERVGVPAFLSERRPLHDYYLSDNFSRYNPEFVHRARGFLREALQQNTVRTLASQVYDSELRYIARIHLDAWHVVQNHPSRDSILDEYQRRISNGQDAGEYIKSAYDDFAPPDPDADWVDQRRVNIARGFWARRILDGSEGEIYAGLVELLSLFDTEALERYR